MSKSIKNLFGGNVSIKKSGKSKGGGAWKVSASGGAASSGSYSQAVDPPASLAVQLYWLVNVYIIIIIVINII